MCSTVHCQLYVVSHASSTPLSYASLNKMVVLMWTLEMEYALLTSMLEFVRNGLRAETGFKKEAWKIAVEDV